MGKEAIFLFGLPHDVGGGATESGDSILLWKKLGYEVTVLYPMSCNCGKPTLRPQPENPWVARLAKAGIEIVPVLPNRLHEVDCLAGAIVVDFCVSHLPHYWEEMRNMGVRLVHSPTMNFVTGNERDYFCCYPPHAVHCQSQFQYVVIGQEWVNMGVTKMPVIHGAFDASRWSFDPLPHEPGTPFNVGRLARPCPSKWHPGLWPMLQKVRDAGVDLRFYGMGWSDELTAILGPPPEWATCLPAGAITSQAFISNLHAMIAPNSGAIENWPRIGLECMASGVALVVDDEGGWKEMVPQHWAGERCASIDGYPAALERLAAEWRTRWNMMTGARQYAFGITSPSRIGAAWEKLFASI